MIRPSQDQRQEEEDDPSVATFDCEFSEEDEEEQRRQAESYLNVEENVESRMHRLGIRDPEEINEAIRREHEIRRVLRELAQREERHKELRRSQENCKSNCKK